MGCGNQCDSSGLDDKVPKKRFFYNKDGSVDSYWTGKLRWSPDTEVTRQ